MYLKQFIVLSAANLIEKRVLKATHQEDPSNYELQKLVTFSPCARKEAYDGSKKPRPNWIK